MKRIFLTSGLVLCMACPAFADVTAGANQCIQSNIGVSQGSTNLKANWTVNYEAMTLNENDGTTTAAGGVTGDQRPTDIFLVGGNGIYKRTGDSEATYVFTQVANGGSVLTAPTGISVTYNINNNLPTGHAASELTTASGATTLPRVFQGYYPYGTTTENYGSATANINSSGNLTPTGATNATGYNNSQPWIAIYNKVSPQVTEPVLPGYSFQGWHVGSDTTTLVSTATVNGTLIGQTTDLTAIWNANDIRINFNCKTAGTTPTPSGTYAFVAGDHGTADDDPTSASGYMLIAMDGHNTITSSCTLTGWTFDGWDCTDNALKDNQNTSLNGTIATSTDVYMKSSNTVTCNAVWHQNNIGITYDSAGGTTIPTNAQTPNAWESCDYDGTVTLPTAPTRTGYTFSGWTVANGN